MSAYLKGEYGISDMFLGVPAKLGRDGVLEVVELPLSSGELSALEAAATGVGARLAEARKAGSDESD